MSKIYVIAGKDYEAKEWIRKNMDERASKGETTLSLSEYVFIYRAQQLKGINNPRGVFYGTWRDRQDMKEIFEALISATSDDVKNSFFADMYFNWNNKDIKGFKPAAVTTSKYNQEETSEIAELVKVAKQEALDANLANVIREDMVKQLATGYEKGWDTTVKTMIDALLDYETKTHKDRYSWN